MMSTTYCILPTSHQQDSTPMTSSNHIKFHTTNLSYITVYRTDSNYFGNVVSNCSFSKIFSPIIRLGWIEAPYKILKLIAARCVCVCVRVCTHVVCEVTNHSKYNILHCTSYYIKCSNTAVT